MTHVHITIPSQPVATLDEVVGRVPMDDATRAALLDQLREREDTLRAEMQLAGATLGTFPELVAMVLMLLGIGSPPSEDERALITHNFEARLAWFNSGMDPAQDPSNSDN